METGGCLQVWCSEVVKGTYGVGLWKNICNGWSKFANFARLEVGAGTRILFWKDHWLGGECLCTKYPELFSFARDKDVLVSECMVWVNGQILWNPILLECCKIGRLSL